LNLDGSWRVVTWRDVMTHYTALSMPELPADIDFDNWNWMWVNTNSQDENPFGLTLRNQNVHSTNLNDSLHCAQVSRFLVDVDKDKHCYTPCKGISYT
jgi:hypothetical protein